VAEQAAIVVWAEAQQIELAASLAAQLDAALARPDEDVRALNPQGALAARPAQRWELSAVENTSGT
jgi:hypothetical protein